MLVFTANNRTLRVGLRHGAFDNTVADFQEGIVEAGLWRHCVVEGGGSGFEYSNDR